MDKLFFVEPPSKNASAQEWEQWLVSDTRARAAAKAALTRSLDHGDPSEFGEDMGMTIKVGGVYRQSVALGFVGDEGNVTLEPAVGANQDGDVAKMRIAHFGGRGKRTRKSGAQRRKARKAKRKGK